MKFIKKLASGSIFSLAKSGVSWLKLSRFGIKVKLILIISSIMITALGGMIFFTSIFFSDEVELRIQENNLNLVQATERWVELELVKFRDEGIRMAKRLFRQGKTRKSTKEFFKVNPEFVYFGITEKGKRFSYNLYNKPLARLIGLSKSDVKKLRKENQEHVKKAAQGEFVLFNASSNVRTLIGISQKIENRTFLIFLAPSRIQKYFKSQKYVSIYMVNKNGEVLIHPDSRVLRARANFAKKEIVQQIWKSPVLAGQGRFVDDADQETYLASYKKLNAVSLALIAQAKEAVVFAPVKRIQNRNLIIMGIFLALAIGVVYFFTKVITAPILLLVDATHKVEEGNYNIDITSQTTEDEIGLLTRSFQHMATGLREREKIKDAFGRFVNKEIAEQILKGEVNLGGAKKNAAVFFSDIRGFTGISESMEPEEVVEFLNKYFTEMVRCVDETGGVVDKYIGDAIMAHWGALGLHENETKSAVKTALLMRKALVEFNHKWEGKFSRIYIGCSINTGEVISGQIGSEDRLEYTVIGDTVNLSSRIESLNKRFGTDILISSYAYERVSDMFHTIEMPSVEIKGKSAPETVYAVLGSKDDPNCPQNIEELRTMLGIEYGEDKR